jgi:hypothetical protein
MTRPVFRNLGDSTLSVRPRPGLDAQHSSTGKEGRHGAALRVISPSHPQRRHDAQGWPAIPGARRYRHSYRDRQKHHLKALSTLASSYPIKGQARALQQRTSKTKVQKPSARLPPQRSTSQAIIFVLLSSLFETWARRPLSQACNPYTSTSVQGNTKLSPPLDVGPSSARTRINPRVFSLHHHPGKGHAALTHRSRTPTGPNTDSWRAR